MKRILFLALTAVILSAAGLYSCSGGGGGGTATTGTVGLYLTDDLSLFSQVTATIDKIQLINTGTGASCDVLAAPVTTNIANLGTIMQLTDVSVCPAGSYNRFHIEFEKGVQLLSGSTGTASLCSFTSFMDQGNGNAPNVLNCDPATGICTLDVNGAVNVLAAQTNKMALDFDLKNFNVTNYGAPGCSVTMKVSPMTPDQMLQHGSEAVTGLVSGLSTTNMTFTLTRGTTSYSVSYSGISNAVQPDLGTLLQRAQDDRLRVMVTAASINLDTRSIAASAVAVKTEGIVSGLTGTGFTLTYANGARTMIVDYGSAVVDGTLANGSWVNVKLIGNDVVTGALIASKVEIETAGVTIED